MLRFFPTKTQQGSFGAPSRGPTARSCHSSRPRPDQPGQNLRRGPAGRNGVAGPAPVLAPAELNPAGPTDAASAGRPAGQRFPPPARKGPAALHSLACASSATWGRAYGRTERHRPGLTGRPNLGRQVQLPSVLPLPPPTANRPAARRPPTHSGAWHGPWYGVTGAGHRGGLHPSRRSRTPTPHGRSPRPRSLRARRAAALVQDRAPRPCLRHGRVRVRSPTSSPSLASPCRCRPAVQRCWLGPGDAAVAGLRPVLSGAP